MPHIFGIVAEQLLGVPDLATPQVRVHLYSFRTFQSRGRGRPPISSPFSVASATVGPREPRGVLADHQEFPASGARRPDAEPDKCWCEKVAALAK
jgi:hypothetical protein